jgi:hypothetical protein
MPEPTTVMLGQSAETAWTSRTVPRRARSARPPPVAITTAAGICTGIYVVSMDDDIGGDNGISETDVVTAAEMARGNAAHVTDASDRCWGTRPGTSASELGHDVRAANSNGRKWRRSA